MDTGYDIIIILAGATNVLRKQTQERLIPMLSDGMAIMLWVLVILKMTYLKGQLV